MLRRMTKHSAVAIGLVTRRLRGAGTPSWRGLAFAMLLILATVANSDSVTVCINRQQSGDGNKP